MVSNDGLGNRSSDGVDLSCDTSTLHSDSNVKVRELVLSEDKNRFEDLQSHDLRLDVLNRLAINLDETPSLLSKGDSGGRLFPITLKKGRIEKSSEMKGN